MSKLHHHIRITNEARLDLSWWSDFLPSWSGTFMILESKWTLSSAMQLFTDASGSWSNHWLQSEWSPEQSVQDIVWKELYAIVSAMNTWATSALDGKSFFIVTITLWLIFGRRGQLIARRLWLLFVYCIFVPHVTINYTHNDNSHCWYK